MPIFRINGEVYDKGVKDGKREVLNELYQLVFDVDGPGGPVYDDITRRLKELDK